MLVSDSSATLLKKSFSFLILNLHAPLAITVPTQYTVNTQYMLVEWIKQHTACIDEFIIISREGNGTPLQYSCLENPMDGGAGWATVHGVTGSQTWLSDFTFTFHFHVLEKKMATHSRCSCLENPRDGGAWWAAVYGVTRVGHDWSDLAAAAA